MNLKVLKLICTVGSVGLSVGGMIIQQLSDKALTMEIDGKVAEAVSKALSKK